MKVKHAAGTKCFVATLDSSDSALPESLLNATSSVSEDATQARLYDSTRAGVQSICAPSPENQGFYAFSEIFISDGQIQIMI